MFGDVVVHTRRKHVTAVINLSSSQRCLDALQITPLDTGQCLIMDYYWRNCESMTDRRVTATAAPGDDEEYVWGGGTVAPGVGNFFRNLHNIFIVPLNLYCRITSVLQDKENVFFNEANNND